MHSSAANRKPETMEAYQYKMAFFTPSTLQELVRHLLLDYFPLTTDELEEWDADPEEYICEVNMLTSADYDDCFNSL